MTTLIVGGGVAGFEAARTCRLLRPDEAVTLVDAEAEVGYYRTLLPQFMVGALPEEKLFFWQGTSDPLLKVITGVRAMALDRRTRTLALADGRTLAYDRLILAHGGEPLLPGELAGPPCKGIFPLRDLATARRTRTWLADHRRIVVFGGSLVGVKTAVHLKQAGFDVALVVRRGHILLRALSDEAATLVEKHLQDLGIRIVVNAPLEGLRQKDGAIDGLKVGGSWLDCDTLLVAAGVVPDRAFLSGADLLTDGELIVSPALQTRDPRIFAAGDVAVLAADGDRVSPNTWPQAVSQGRLAAENLYRTNPLPHRDLTRLNAMELHGLAMVVLGPPVTGAEVISHSRPEIPLRRELFLVNGRPVGGALIGDISAAGTLHALINAGRPLTPEEAGLLKPCRARLIRFPETTGLRQALILTTKRSMP